ncbi:endosomal/lysosomal proton channel TMEM175-like [Clytia hemisphaerica]|uniref:Endosomal/lysosomal proton channel TMEM175 n=1 Tax=Clytia hemisphaerica TaxID=252671 RepID=A0A7M5WZE6_9CNID|eukprot:TCONS_00058294-protein
MITDSRRASYITHNDPKKKWKDLQENYERHHNRKISSHVHHGDVTTTTRLLGYTDAMMATCATFLVIPIRHSKEFQKKGILEKEETLLRFLKRIQTEVLMFFMGFLLVATIWESTNIRCIVVKRLDDMLVLLSALQMLATSILPFSVALQGYFPGSTATVIMTMIILLLVEIFEAIIVYYAFASPRLLHIEMKSWPKESVYRIRNALLKKNLINISFIMLGALAEFVDYRVSWIFFSLLILNPIARKVYLHLKRRQKAPESDHLHFYWFLMKGNISKERVEAFTDAATAIIACVMILDIVIEQFKIMDVLSPDHLWPELKHLYGEFLTFVAAYIGVSLLWYVNHTVIHLFHTINTVLLYLQKLFLCFLSLLPLTGNIVHDFVGKGVNMQDSKLAIRYGSVAAFMASLCNLLMVVWGYHKKEKVLHRWALKGCKTHSQKQKDYIEVKVLNMPFWALVSFIGSFGSVNVARIVAATSYTCMCFSFIVLKLMYVNHIGKHEHTKDLRLTIKCQSAGDRRVSSVPRVGVIGEATDGGELAAVDHEHGRLPSDSVIAKHGGEEMSFDEILIEKLQNIEYDGNEVINEDLEEEDDDIGEAANDDLSMESVSEGNDEVVTVENGHLNHGLEEEH